MKNTLFYSRMLPLSSSSLISLINIDNSQLIISDVFHIIQNWHRYEPMSSMSICSIFHLRLENIPYIVDLEKLAMSRIFLGINGKITTKEPLCTRNLEFGGGKAQGYYGQIGLILTGGRSNTLWGRLGFENWLFTTLLGIVAIFQQVIMALLGPCMSRQYWNAGVQLLFSSRQMSAPKVAVFLLTKWEKSLEMVGPQRRILIFTTLLPSLVAGYCHWEPSVFHRTGIKLILYDNF